MSLDKIKASQSYSENLFETLFDFSSDKNQEFNFVSQQGFIHVNDEFLIK